MLYDQFLIAVENFIERIINTVLFVSETSGVETLELIFYLSCENVHLGKSE